MEFVTYCDILKATGNLWIVFAWLTFEIWVCDYGIRGSLLSMEIAMK